MKKFYVFCIGLLFSLSVYAISPAQLLQKKLNGFHSMTADFQQLVISEDGSVLQKSSGIMKISRPGKFRWEVLKPLKQLIITNGKKIWSYEPDLKQVAIRKFENTMGETPALLLTHSNVDLQKQFNVALLQSKQNSSKFQLTPKQSSSLFDHITLMFNKNQIASMTFSNQLGQKTIIKFSDVKINPDIPSSDFIFQIPKGVDVVKNM